jgi:phosphate transport system permease protein
VALDLKRKRKIINGLVVGVVSLLALISFVPLFLMLMSVFKKGISNISWQFLTSLPKPVGELGGGIVNSIVGTVLLMLMAVVLSVPLGIATGIFLREKSKSKLGGWVQSAADVLQGTPSVVIGLLVYIWVVKPMGGFSALSGAIALAIMMLPVIIRATEEALKLLPASLKEGAYALGSTPSQVIIRVVLPAAFPGIISGVMLSIARVIGETAPLLFTAFGNPFMNYDPLKPVQSLPLTIYTYAISPYEEWHSLAWAAAMVLIVIVLIMNIGARVFAGKFSYRN